MTFCNLSQFGEDHFAWFQAIASQVLGGKLYINEECFEVFDISIHYTSDKFNYPHCHASLVQSKPMRWYFYDDDVQVLDLTFSEERNKSSFGGVLLRGIKSEKEKIIGPQKIHKKIKEILGDDYLKNINGISINASKLRFELDKNIAHLPLYKLPRQNISPTLKDWSPSTTYRSYIHPLRFSKLYPIPTEATNKELEIVFSYFHGYLSEALLTYGGESVNKIINEFKTFVPTVKFNEGQFCQFELVEKFLKHYAERK